MVSFECNVSVTTYNTQDLIIHSVLCILYVVTDTRESPEITIIIECLTTFVATCRAEKEKEDQNNSRKKNMSHILGAFIEKLGDFPSKCDVSVCDNTFVRYGESDAVVQAPKKVRKAAKQQVTLPVSYKARKAMRDAALLTDEDCQKVLDRTGPSEINIIDPAVVLFFEKFKVAFMKVSHALGNVIIIKDTVGAHDLNVVNVTALLDDTAWLTSDHVDGYTRMLTAAFEAGGERRNFKILDHSFFKF